MNDRWRRQQPCRILTQHQQHERRGAANRMLREVQAINCQTHQDRKNQWRNKEGCSSIEGNRARDSTQGALLYIESPNPYIFTALFFYAFPCLPHPLFIGFPPLRWKVAPLFIRAPMNAKVVQTFCRTFFFFLFDTVTASFPQPLPVLHTPRLVTQLLYFPPLYETKAGVKKIRSERISKLTQGEGKILRAI